MLRCLIESALVMSVPIPLSLPTLVLLGARAERGVLTVVVVRSASGVITGHGSTAPSQ